MGFEPTISAGERPQNYVSDRAATGTGKYSANTQINIPMKDLFDSSTNNVGQLYYCCHSNTLICKKS